MALNPFLTAPSAVYVARNVRVTPAGEVVIEPGNNLPRVIGYLESFLIPIVVSVQPPVINVPTFSQEDFTAAMLNLLPQGRAWPKGPDSNLYQTMFPLVGTYQRDIASPVGLNTGSYGSAQRATDLLMDTMPVWSTLGAGAVTEQLDVWNETLGLPDNCLGATPSLDQQIKQAVARFVGTGGQNILFYQQFAASLGFNITISEFAPFRADINKADTPLYDFNQFFVWQVNSANNGGWFFEADLNTADEPLGYFGNTVLQCEFERIAPAHTIILFTYTTEVDQAINVIGGQAVSGAGTITALADLILPITGAKATTAAGTVHHTP